MKTIGAYEARTHFAKLLDLVANGETITITKHGVAVARIVPTQDKTSVDEAIARWRELRRDIILGSDLSIREMIEEGRRY